jgi:hypothetical protein
MSRYNLSLTLLWANEMKGRKMKQLLLAGTAALSIAT